MAWGPGGAKMAGGCRGASEVEKAASAASLRASIGPTAAPPRGARVRPRRACRPAARVRRTALRRELSACPSAPPYVSAPAPPSPSVRFRRPMSVSAARVCLPRCARVPCQNKLSKPSRTVSRFQAGQPAANRSQSLMKMLRRVQSERFTFAIDSEIALLGLVDCTLER